MARADTIFTTEFLALNGLAFLAFCTIAVFFDYYQYLKTLPIDPQRLGLLIGVFSVSSLALRPFLSFIIQPTNAKAWIMWCGAFLIAALLLYESAETFWGVLAVRVVHGAAYVGFLTAIVARLVKCVPEGKSGQAFALFSVVTLLPYAIIPPLIQPVSIMLGGFPRALDLTGLLLLLIVPLCGLLTTESPLFEERERRLGLWEAIENIKSFKVVRALVLTLLVWTAFAPLFFFLHGFGTARGIDHPGLFFTLSTFSEIGVRVGVGRYLDKMDKTKMLGLACAWLTLCYVLLAHVADAPSIFFGMGVCFGIGWGFAMPLLSGIVFDVSQDHFRSLNTNLGMQMSQAGFFFGPSLGGLVLVHWGYELVFYGCAALTTSVLLMTLIPARRLTPISCDQ